MSASSASSSSPSRERRKKKAKKEAKNTKKAGKRARDDAGDGAGGGKARRRSERVADEGRPNLAASGLLDESEEEQPPAADRGRQQPRPTGGGDAPRGLAARSRSRDVPAAAGARGAGVPPPAGGGLRSQDGDSGGFGKGTSGKGGGKGGDGPPEEQEPKEEPNFEASGLLGLEDNSKNGIALKFTVPAEARYPTMKWRLYIFTKQAEAPKIVHVHRMVGVLFGKDRRVVDVPTDHPTCSKQHAVMHYRQASGEVKPYIMDLESTNGTFLNGKRLDPARYYEMRERDVLKFGMSSREFVLLHAGSANHMDIDPSRLRSPSE